MRKKELKREKRSKRGSEISYCGAVGTFVKERGPRLSFLKDLKFRNRMKTVGIRQIQIPTPRKKRDLISLKPYITGDLGNHRSWRPQKAGNI